MDAVRGTAGEELVEAFSGLPPLMESRDPLSDRPVA